MKRTLLDRQIQESNERFERQSDIIVSCIVIALFAGFFGVPAIYLIWSLFQ